MNILDLYGTEHEYKAEMFSTWENTHAILDSLWGAHGRTGFGFEK